MDLTSIYAGLQRPNLPAMRPRPTAPSERMAPPVNAPRRSPSALTGLSSLLMDRVRGARNNGPANMGQPPQAGFANYLQGLVTPAASMRPRVGRVSY